MVRRAAAVLLALLLSLTGCAGGRQAPSAEQIVLPMPGAGFDYQLGGEYQPPEGSDVVVRQRDAKPAADAYSICYVNAFQTEADPDGPDGVDAWPEGTVWDDVEDPDWPGEHPIDIGSRRNRELAVEFVGTRFEECAERGFSAVELDNLDTFTRYPGAPFGRQDVIAYATLLVDEAARLGLAVGQKNTVELLDAASGIGFSFAIVENCGEYDECREYLRVYDRRVYAVEYTPEGFASACDAVGGDYAVILRDLKLATQGQPGYAYDAC